VSSILISGTPLSGAALRSALLTLPDVTSVVVADSGDEVLTLYERDQPDLVLIAVGEPLGGIEASRRLIEVHPEAQVVLTIMDDGDQASGMLATGVRGVLPHDASRQEVLSAVTRVLAELSSSPSRTSPA